MAMTYKEALKQTSAKSQGGNFLVFSFGWHSTFVLPYKEGMAFLAAMDLAEVYEDQHSGRPKIQPLSGNELRVEYLSQEQYRQIKMAQLMNVELDQLKGIQKEQEA